MIGPEEGVMQSRAQAMAAMLELMTDQLLIVCNGFPHVKPVNFVIGLKIFI